MKNEKAKSNQNGDLRHQAEERLMGSGNDPAGFEGEGKDARLWFTSCRSTRLSWRCKTKS